MVFDSFVRLLEQIAWPLTVVCIALMFRGPLSSLIKSLQKLEYKGIAAMFQQNIQTTADAVQAETGTIELPDSTTGEGPRLAVLLAWDRLLRAASEKLDELSPSGRWANADPERALGYFEYLGVFERPIERAISELRELRNQANHIPSDAISIDSAMGYAQTAKVIQDRIARLSSLPRMKLNRLTLLILELNALLDSGKYAQISIDDVRAHISPGTVLQFLKSAAGSDIDLSLHMGEHDNIGFEQEYSRQLKSICESYGGNEMRKWGVENSGLCLLIAWTNEIVQQGSGWLPMEFEER